MHRNARWLAAVIGCCGVALACGSSTGPRSASLAGGWFGRTSQGAPIAFNVSADDEVTSISIGYDFNGCRGSQEFTGLSLATAPNVTCIPGPCSGAVASYRAFGYSSGGRDEPGTVINGLFLPTGGAEGTVGFRDFPGCGTAMGVPWSAVRR
jgi:hypothetical protein